MRRVIRPGLFAALFVCISAGLCQPAAAATDRSPARVGLVVEVAGVEKLLREMDAVALGIGAPSPAENLRKGLAEMVGAPALAGVDTNKPLSLCLVFPEAPAALGAGGSQPPQLVVITPVQGNGDAYIGAVKAKHGAGSKAGDTWSFDAAAAGTPGSRAFHVAVGGGKAVSGTSLPDVQLVQRQLAETRGQIIPLRGLAGTVRVGIDAQACLPFIEQSFASSQAAMKNAGKSGPQSAMPGMKMDPAKVMEAEMAALLDIVRQISSFGIGISGRADMIEVYTRLSPVAGSTIAKLMAKQQPVARNTVGVLPGDALLAVVGSGMQLLDELAEPYAKFMDSMTGAMGLRESGGSFREMMLGMKGMYTGSYAIGVLAAGAGESGMGFVEVLGVTSGAKALTFMTNSVAQYNTRFGSTTPGVRMELGAARSAAGTLVYPYRYTADPQAATSVTDRALLPLLQRMNGEIAAVGNTLVYAVGAPWVMDKTLARLRSPEAMSTTPAVLRSVLAQTKTEPTCVYGLGLTRLLKAGITALTGSPQLASSIPDSTGSLSGFSYIDSGEGLGVMRISTAEIASLRNAGPALAAAMASLMMGAGSPAGAAGAPSLRDSEGARCRHNLRILDAAKEQCALEKTLANGAPVSESALKAYLKGGQLPVCPSGGTYVLAPIGDAPTCTVPGHTLP